MTKTLFNFCLVTAFSTILVTGCLSGRPPFEDLTYATDFSRISSQDGYLWEIAFEFSSNSTFTGVVRHTSLWYDSSAPFMSHDILVTTGDFESQDSVDVSVIAHKFFYRWQGAQPSGTIHLLHILPATAEIFDQLTRIKKWDHVSISGREILKIDRYDPDAKYLGYMIDEGCNTILVTSVHINSTGTPVP